MPGPERAGEWRCQSPGKGSVGMGEGRKEVELLACECGGDLEVPV